MLQKMIYIFLKCLALDSDFHSLPSAMVPVVMKAVSASRTDMLPLLRSFCGGLLCGLVRKQFLLEYESYHTMPFHGKTKIPCHYILIAR